MEGGPVGPEVNEPLALLVLDHADPAGQHAGIQNTTSLLEHLLAQPEPSLGGGLVERISDGEPTARQVPDTTLDSRLKEGITYLEHPATSYTLDSRPMEGITNLERSALGVSLDSGPTEGRLVWNHWAASTRGR